MHSVARGVTDPGVGSGALLALFDVADIIHDNASGIEQIVNALGHRPADLGTAMWATSRIGETPTPATRRRRKHLFETLLLLFIFGGPRHQMSKH